MTKSNIELTSEIAIAFIESWNAKSTTGALQLDDVTNLIKSIYETLENLD